MNGEGPVIAAIDIGTHACRLLIAVPRQRNGMWVPHVVNAYSAAIRLGDGLNEAGRIGEAAMDRALAALAICAERIRRFGVTHMRAVATEACRRAANADIFVERAEAQTGLKLAIITPEEEARLAALGCLPMVEASAESALIFDIGGGSTELILVGPLAPQGNGPPPRRGILAWTSVPVGVVNLAEGHARPLAADLYPRLRTQTGRLFAATREKIGASGTDLSRSHLLGTSGTLTTLAGVKLGLNHYDRRRIDGAWMTRGEVDKIVRAVVSRDFDERARMACIGEDRADLILPGCAILQAIMRAWPCDRLRVADRGVREGLLIGLLDEIMPPTQQLMA
jgi:exopolyphosphatase/guanosine-5'-triphosphate,3'-diphosphate pyrophosphatase